MIIHGKIAGASARLRPPQFPSRSSLWGATATGVAFVFAVQNWITGGPYGQLIWPRNLSIAFVQWWTWAVLTPPLILLAARYPLTLLRAGSWLPLALGLSLAYLVHRGLVTIVERLLDRVTPGESLGLTFANLLRKRAGIDRVRHRHPPGSLRWLMAIADTTCLRATSGETRAQHPGDSANVRILPITPCRRPQKYRRR